MREVIMPSSAVKAKGGCQEEAMPSGLSGATQMLGPFAPTFLCWSCLILTVLSLALTFLWTNITAFARRTRNSGSDARKPAVGSVVPEKSNW